MPPPPATIITKFRFLPAVHVLVLLAALLTWAYISSQSTITTNKSSKRTMSVSGEWEVVVGGVLRVGSHMSHG